MTSVVSSAMSPTLGESGQRLRKLARVQHPEALGGAGEGDVQVGRATWAVGKYPLRFDQQDGAELQSLGLRRRDRPWHTRRPDDHAGADAARLGFGEFRY